MLRWVLSLLIEGASVDRPLIRLVQLLSAPTRYSEDYAGVADHLLGEILSRMGTDDERVLSMLEDLRRRSPSPQVTGG